MTPQDIQTIKQRFKIIGNSQHLNRAIERAVRVAPTDLSVLVTGESGVGKEHFPKIIHEFSTRKHGPYFAINCGAIPEGTIDSELFGHEKGAFTDARTERKGYFEIANGGTLFLDEVGELPMQTQVRLLRVLETGEFIRMGSSTVQKTDVRVVAATNLDIPRAIKEGKFREDLYYRLNSVEIHLPPLRERKDDIPLLFRKFASDFAERYRMPVVRLNEEATRVLQAGYWGGNIRQLKNVAEQISIMERNHDITADTLRAYMPSHEMQQGISLVGTAAGQMNSGEREMMLKAIFDLKRELNDIRRQMDEMRQGVPTGQAWAGHSEKPVIPESTQAETQVQQADSEWEYAEEVETNDTNTSAAPTPTQTTMQDVEREAIRRVLEKNGGNRKVAAAELRISERTLYRKIKDYNL